MGSASDWESIADSSSACSEAGDESHEKDEVENEAAAVEPDKDMVELIPGRATNDENAPLELDPEITGENSPSVSTSNLCCRRLEHLTNHRRDGLVRSSADRNSPLTDLGRRTASSAGSTRASSAPSRSRSSPPSHSSRPSLSPRGPTSPLARRSAPIRAGCWSTPRRARRRAARQHRPSRTCSVEPTRHTLSLRRSRRSTRTRRAGWEARATRPSLSMPTRPTRTSARTTMARSSS